jgi:hypothetical protein
LTRPIPKGIATWWLPLFVSTLLIVAIPADACEKTAAEVSLGARPLDSKLTEYASGGTILVRENGSLSGTDVRTAVSCDRWSVGLEIISSGGDRDYVGQTSVGTPLITKSRIDDRAVVASLYWRYAESLQFGMDMTRQHSTRKIAGTNLVAGYPETYDRLVTQIGTKWDVPTTFGLWTISGSAAVYGEQAMNLQLPGKDATALTFERPKQWELGIQWRKDLGKHLFIDATYRYIKTEIGESSYGIVTSNGIPVGVAYQPKMKLVDQPLLVAIGVRF